MLDHFEVITIVANTAYGDRMIDLRKYHYGSIVVPVAHTGDIGFMVAPDNNTINLLRAVDGSNNLLQVTTYGSSLGNYPLPQVLFSNNFAQLRNQIADVDTICAADEAILITVKE